MKRSGPQLNKSMSRMKRTGAPRRKDRSTLTTKIHETGRQAMANAERRSAAHYYTIDVVLNENERDELLRLRNAGTGDRASFTVTVGPAREMAEKDRRPKM